MCAYPYPNCYADDFAFSFGDCDGYTIFDWDCYPCENYLLFAPNKYYSSVEFQQYINLGCVTYDYYLTSENDPAWLELATQLDKKFCFFYEFPYELADYFTEPEDPCLIYYKSDNVRICTTCKYGSLRILFLYNDEEYAWCGVVSAVDDEGNIFCSLSDYYATYYEEEYNSHSYFLYNS